MNKQMKNFCDNKKKDLDYHKEIKYYTLFSPITILLGPNGTGKSASIKLIKDDLKRLDYNVVYYSTSNDDVVKKYGGPFRFRPSAIRAAFLSEGERMKESFTTWVEEEMIPAILKDKNDLFILIDEADSGLSLDKMYETFCDIIFIIKQELKNNRRIKMVISANSYELAELFNSEESGTVSYIWVPTEEYIILGSYNKFKKSYIEYDEEMNKNRKED